MEYFRKTKKSTLALWVLFLSIALVCAQGVTLHVHAVDHEHHHQHSHDNLFEDTSVDEHTHISIAHLSADASHSGSHDQVIYESDACSDCLLTKNSNMDSLNALLYVLFILLLTGFYRHNYERLRDDKNFYLFRFSLTPPFRAPPVK